MSRWIRFLFVVLIGAGLGLFYGWKVNPKGNAATSPGSLRIDYQSDYVLMVAEIYSLDRDLDAAIRKLDPLGRDPLESVRAAVLFAETHGYVDRDVAVMHALFDAVEARSVVESGPDPGSGATPAATEAAR